MWRWQAGFHGRSYLGVRDRPARSWPGGAGARAGCQRRGDRRAAPSLDGGAASDGTAALCTRRPDGVGDVGAAAATGTLAGLPLYARHAASVASGAGGASLDLPTHRARTAGAGPRRRRPGGADGAGEPEVGVPENRGGVPKAGFVMNPWPFWSSGHLDFRRYVAA